MAPKGEIPSFQIYFFYFIKFFKVVCGRMQSGYGCTTDGEYTAGYASDAARCGDVCENLGLEGCCEWQDDHSRCVFQPNDDAVSVDSGRSSYRDLRSAAYCSSALQGKLK